MLPFKENSFDLILLNEVFEHLRINPIFTVKEIARVLSKEGCLILSTPSPFSFSRFQRFLQGKNYFDIYKEYSKLDSAGHMGHIREYSKKELKVFLEKMGFVVKKVYMEHYQRFSKRNFIYNIIISLFKRTRPYQVLICYKK